MDALELTDIARAWDKVAPGYDKFVTPQYFDLGARVLEDAGLLPGMRLLDVAAGSGALSLAAARIGANVTAVDISPVMIQRLRERAREERLELDARVMDGQALDLDGNSFDMTASEFGVMLFPDLPRGLREMVRVTKPGGQVVMIALGSLAKVEFFQFFIRAIQAAVPSFTGPPADAPPLPFQVQDPAKLRREMEGAGLKGVRVEQATKELKYQSGKHFWDWIMNSNPVAGAVLSEVGPSEDQIATMKRAANRLIRERAGGADEAVLVSPINIGIGTK